MRFTRLRTDHGSMPMALLAVKVIKFGPRASGTLRPVWFVFTPLTISELAPAVWSWVLVEKR